MPYKEQMNHLLPQRYRSNLCAVSQSIGIFRQPKLVGTVSGRTSGSIRGSQSLAVVGISRTPFGCSRQFELFEEVRGPQYMQLHVKVEFQGSGKGQVRGR